MRRFGNLKFGFCFLNFDSNPQFRFCKQNKPKPKIYSRPMRKNRFLYYICIAVMRRFENFEDRFGIWFFQLETAISVLQQNQKNYFFVVCTKIGFFKHVVSLLQNKIQY